MTHTATTPDLSQCTYKTAKGRRCKLAPGHAATSPDGKPLPNGGHRMVLRDEIAKPKPLAEVVPQGFTLAMELIPAGTTVTREFTRKKRDKDQQRVDRDAKNLYDAWVKAGKPDDFDKAVAKRAAGRYIVPP